MSDLFNYLGWLFPISVIVTSFLASPHCVGMCGPLIFAMGSSRNKLIGYHLGRMVSYTALGATAGSLGGAVLSLSTHPLISVAFLGAFAIMLAVIGWKTFHGQSLHFSIVNGKLWSQVTQFKGSGTLSTTLTGFFSIFLPCGHLYTFALAATATGSALKGGAMMLAFWLGTLPALGFGIHLLRSQIPKLGSTGYKLAAILLVTTGFLSLGSFASHVFNEAPSTTTQQDPRTLRCH